MKLDLSKIKLVKGGAALVAKGQTLSATPKVSQPTLAGNAQCLTHTLLNCFLCLGTPKKQRPVALCDECRASSTGINIVGSSCPKCEKIAEAIHIRRLRAAMRAGAEERSRRIELGYTNPEGIKFIVGARKLTGDGNTAPLRYRVA